MPFFNYKARNSRGELLRGVLESTDGSAVANYLLNIGATPIEINMTNRAEDAGAGGFLHKFFGQPITAVDVQLFSRQMYTLLKAGVPIMQGLQGLRDSATNKSFAHVIKDLKESLDSGRELSTSMRAHPKVFSPYYTSMIQVGEMTGRLSEIFVRLYDFLQFDRTMREQIASALRYPKFVVSAMIAAIGIINIFVIPQFAKIFTKANFELPIMTRVLVGSSAFTIKFWPFIVIVIVGGFLAFRVFRSTKEGLYRWDKFKLRLPIAGQIIMKGTMARFARSFSLAYKSGVPIGAALGVVGKTVDNAYIAGAVEQMRDGVERGESILRTATTTGVFAPMVLQMIAVGEESGDLDSLMDEIADMYEHEVEYELKALATRIEPILITFMGILVLILALGVFVPMWQLGQVMLHKH